MSENKTLMIVDDSKVSRMMILAIVKDKYPDMIVYEVSNGQEALELSEGKSIDFFSVDYNMPGVDGLDLITQLKNNFPDSKFALLTANVQEAIYKKSEKIDVICINKPIGEACIGKMLEYFYA